MENFLAIRWTLCHLSRTFRKLMRYIDTWSYFRLQELLQEISPAEPDVPVPGEQELPDRPAS